MTREGSARLTLILATVAAGLAFTAAVVIFVRSGQVNWTLIAAGLFILTYAVSAKPRLGPPS